MVLSVLEARASDWCSISSSCWFSSLKVCSRPFSCSTSRLSRASRPAAFVLVCSSSSPAQTVQSHCDEKYNSCVLPMALESGHWIDQSYTCCECLRYPVHRCNNILMQLGYCTTLHMYRLYRVLLESNAFPAPTLWCSLLWCTSL